MRIERCARPAPPLLGPLRSLLDAAFGGAFTDADWAHALGGVHAIAWSGGQLAGHAALVPRTLWVGDRPIASGYLEAVAVAPAAQGKGIGTGLLHALAPSMRRYPLCALSTDKPAFYARLGWRRWQGSSAVRTAQGCVPTPDEDEGLMVWWPPGAEAVDLHATLACAARPGDDW